MRFNGIRLSGFKSFVDPVSLDIVDGLTGVVGPNGCGKSNLVEALRWVMGESSARQMRGGEMDDVIFSGTTGRPAYNAAEVTLVVDNAEGRAPAAISEDAELNVTRRIERGRGTQFRVNGRETRGRDVQMLFADAATGARSAGIVGQGRIGAIVNAKPAERRILLEEAANTRGLQARRHEAELRLRAAETNVARLEDVLRTLDDQRQGLRQQARQAVRYRKVNEQIRQASAVVLYGRWRHLVAEHGAAAKAVEEAEAAVAAAAADAGQKSARHAELAAALPGLRNAEAEGAARLQRLALALAELDNEEARLRRAREDAALRLRQIDEDVDRETVLRRDAGHNVESLAQERKAVEAAQADEETEAAAARRLEDARGAVEAGEAGVATLAEAIASGEARQSALARQAQFAVEREQRLTRQLALLDEQAREIGDAAAAPDDLDRARTAAEAAEQQSVAAGRALDEAEERRTEQALVVDQAVQALQDVNAVIARLDAEADALDALLAADMDDGAVPVIDLLEVEAGYEAALGAALGGDLNAPVSSPEADGPARGWTARTGSGAHALPDAAVALDSVIKGPAELTRRLSQIGVVPDAACAASLQPLLHQGQRLTTPAGGLWRWDGFAVAVGTPDATTIRMRQRNRKAEIEAERAERAGERADADAALAKARARLAERAEREQRQRQIRRQAQQAGEAAREQAVALERQQLETAARIQGLADSRARILADCTEAAEQRRAAEAETLALPDIDDLRRQAAEDRNALDACREALATARSEHDRLVHDMQARKARLAAIDAELRSWSARAGHATARIDELARRRDSETAEIARLETRPAEITAQRAGLAATRAEADAERRAAADALAAAETGLDEAGAAAREADRAVAARRETRVRAEANLEHFDSTMADLRDRISEQLDCEPDAIPAEIDLDPEAVPEDLDAVEARVERLARERERLGAVNLRAEQEVEDLDARIAAMETERDDLAGAILRLRRAIAALNREGRERLANAFETMNGHFQDLFTRLFGGGRAHLALVEADDPLDAGLEIMARPPGKTLQALSLLSGGEQTMTALALVFAAFLTNPSPICILDEVDAALDDNNVARFCSLLETIAEATGTRFLVVTHHRLTMARMNRLYGVTMAERGVSQLVSVDLGQAVQLRETA